MQDLCYWAEMILVTENPKPSCFLHHLLLLLLLLLLSPSASLVSCLHLRVVSSPNIRKFQSSTILVFLLSALSWKVKYSKSSMILLVDLHSNYYHLLSTVSIHITRESQVSRIRGKSNLIRELVDDLVCRLHLFMDLTWGGFVP